ncbi:cellulose synthase operon protein YhjQ/BcsQ [Gemmatimonas sp.]|uniref:MinD/ParA family ATP-binding protein n=1 Tax=Gemmatimonas sp. TaxID=1962908 RepID=UPI00286A854B|nr:cellulose synthase operon protein YhjQ/BcsQ [Gemmatimonas sp.]
MSGYQLMSPPRGTASVSQVDALLGRGPRNSAQQGGAARGATTLLVASGRGGSGTSLVSALLAVAAAGDGRRVLLIDADDFVGPLALTLGVQARASWQDLRGGRVSPTDVATPVSTTLTLVAGGAARLAADGLALSAAERRACMRRLGVLADGMDLVVIDCGARIDTVLAAITPHADERLIAVSAGSDPVGLASTYALCKAVHSRHGALPMDVLVNRHEGSEAARCFDAIDAGARQFLGVSLRLVGAVPADPTLDAALRAGMPFPHAAAGSPAAIAAHEVVMRTLATASLSRSGT